MDKRRNRKAEAIFVIGTIIFVILLAMIARANGELDFLMGNLNPESTFDIYSVKFMLMMKGEACNDIAAKTYLTGTNTIDAISTMFGIK